MARLIKHTATGPVEVKPASESAWICMCGLSSNYPYCDGSHKHARQQEAEGKIYIYQGHEAKEIQDPGGDRSV